MRVDALATLVLLLNLVPSHDAAAGSLARCFRDKDCAKGLKCRGTSDILSNVGCTKKESYCACAPTDISKLFCTVPSSCKRFETCTTIPRSVVKQVLPAAESLNLKLCLDKSQTPFFRSPKKCTGNSRCNGRGEACVTILQASLCASSSVPRRRSNKEPPSETNPSSSLINATFPEVTPTESQSSDSVSVVEEGPRSNVCIASKFLHHLNPELLLYKTSYEAHVLCDMNKSCATPGHMVVYQGQSMMMSSYCSKVGCQRRVMHVNSPRYKRKLRIASSTKDLEFGAFSARYGTQVEETLLALAVRLGL